MPSSTLDRINRARYVRSRISYFPLSQSILPIPEGLAVVIFETDADIQEYFQLRGVNDPENFDILPIRSIFDFMREMADVGYSGIWFFNNFPILFGNYLSDIDIELPTFAFTFDGNYFGATGEIEPPSQFHEWKNFAKTDNILRKYVQFTTGVPLNPADPVFSIVHKNADDYSLALSGDEVKAMPFVIFPHASPLQGPYVSDLGAYCVFTDESLAARFLESISNAEDKYRIVTLPGLLHYLEIISRDFPFVDIGINPGNERYLQGYFLRESPPRLIRTVHGVYKISENATIEEIAAPDGELQDTVDRPNTFDSTFRGLLTTVQFPLRKLLKRTREGLPRREAERLTDRVFSESPYNGPEGSGIGSIGAEDISTDSFLIFGFDKVSGESFSNNEDLIPPYVFEDILQAITYFYHQHLLFEKNLRLNGFYYCASNRHYPGSGDEESELKTLKEQQLALRDLVEDILREGYRVEHGELLKAFVNRSSLSLEIEVCGYLSDLSLYMQTYLETTLSKLEDHAVTDKIEKIAKRARSKSEGRLILDEAVQNRIRRYLGSVYQNISLETLCILESALTQFDNAEKRINRDFAGISMKLCKSFERETLLLVFGKWREAARPKFDKDRLKVEFSKAEQQGDEESRRLLGWALGRNKLELGSMMRIVQKAQRTPKNPALELFYEIVSGFKNRDFLLSPEFVNACELVSTRYRNGGVHEKIVNYDICKEAMEKILIGRDSFLAKLADV